MNGQVIAHYSILRRIGSGGMGEVYLAEDLKLGRRVAIKTLSRDRALRPQERRRFLHEGKAQAMLNHPNIATFYEVGESDGLAYIAMEYIEGETLSRCIQSRKYSVRDILDLAIQIGEGLQAAHVEGVIHRDIKPDKKNAAMYLEVVVDGTPLPRRFRIVDTPPTVDRLSFKGKTIDEIGDLLAETINLVRTGRIEEHTAATIDRLAWTLLRARTRTNLEQRLRRLETKVGVGKR